MSEAVELGPVELAVATSLVLIAGVVSVALRLGLEKRLALATARTVVQLLLVGLVLRWVFAVAHWPLVFTLALAMVALAARAALERPARRVAGTYTSAFVSLGLSCVLCTLLTLTCVVGAEPWYAPRYFLPLLGMALGNGLTGASLCIDHFLEQVVSRADQVEMELCHGASPWEASRPLLADAVRRGLVPTLNSMMVVGIVSLPGMMTGQILAGADPLQAVAYQIVVLFMIAAATALACMLLAVLLRRRVFDEFGRPRVECITRE